MIAQRRQIITDMSRCVGLRVAEDRIDREPGQVCTVLVIRDLIDILRFIEDCRRGGQEPITGVVNVDIGGRALEVIDISRTHTSYVPGVTRNEVRKLGIDAEGRRCCGGDPRDLIDRVREPLHLGLPTSVDTPDRVR